MIKRPHESEGEERERARWGSALETGAEQLEFTDALFVVFLLFKSGRFSFVGVVFLTTTLSWKADACKSTSPHVRVSCFSDSRRRNCEQEQTKRKNHEVGASPPGRTSIKVLLRLYLQVLVRWVFFFSFLATTTRRRGSHLPLLLAAPFS